MKKVFLLLLLISATFAEFQFQSMDVSIRMLDNGTAKVEERFNFIIFGQYSKQLYEAGLNTNTLSRWQSITNVSEIKTHISASGSDLSNLLIRPQPLVKSKSGLDVWYGQIIVSYDANPYFDKNGKAINGTGVFTMDNYKPRTTRYILNGNSFNFQRTETGDIKLDEQTTLSITPPSNARIMYVNPITKNLQDSKFPVQATTLSWNGLTLVQFSVIYEVEQSLDREVVEFFLTLQENMRSFLISQEGIFALIIAAILVLSYFYLRVSQR